MNSRSGRDLIDHTSISQPITVGDRTIRAVARVKGRQGAGFGRAGDRAPEPGKRDEPERGGGAGGGAGAFVSVTPMEFIVRDADGQRYRVPVTDPMREVRRGMLQGALGTAAVCWLVILIVNWLKNREA